MVGQTLKKFVESSGVAAHDVPKVLGTFAAVKYSTLTASIVLGVRCQPLRRLLLARSQALPTRSVTALHQPKAWAHLQRQKHQPRRAATRFAHSMAPGGLAPRLGRLPVPFVEKQLQVNSRSGLDAARSRYGRARLGRAIAAARSLRSRSRVRFGQAFDAAKLRYTSARAQYRDVKGRWRIACRRILGRRRVQLAQLYERLQQRAVQHRRNTRLTWHTWASKKYWKLSDDMEKVASSSSVCRLLTSTFKIDPKRLAIGFAEGTLLYKSTAWIHVPLQLWFIVQLYRHRPGKAILLDEGAAPGSGSSDGAASSESDVGWQEAGSSERSISQH